MTSGEDLGDIMKIIPKIEEIGVKSWTFAGF